MESTSVDLSDGFYQIDTGRIDVGPKPYGPDTDIYFRLLNNILQQFVLRTTTGTYFVKFKSSKYGLRVIDWPTFF